LKTKFRNTRIKTLSIAVSLITIFAFSMLAPLTLAQVGIPQPTQTRGYISIAPTLVGVDQIATVNLWVYPMPTNYMYQPYFRGFTGIEVTFLKPDGSKDTFMPVDGTGQFAAGQTEAIGTVFFYYKPTMAGNWSVSFTMPEQNLTDSSGTVLYSACTSNTAYFTVQTDPVNAGLLNGYPWAELPNENTYWSYPINSNNREWSAISGDWLQPCLDQFGMMASSTSNYWQPYGSGPNTSHIVWNKQLSAGGIINGEFGSTSYSTVEERGVVIIEGKVFVNNPSNAGGFSYASGTSECIDLTTGKTLYKLNDTITCGLHVPGNAYSQSSMDPSVVLGSTFGSSPIAYLFAAAGTTWKFYDPNNGILMRSIVNASAGSYRFVDDTPFVYGVASGNLYAWNMSKVVNNNWPTGIIWQTPLPTAIAIARGVRLFGVSADRSTVVVNTYNQYWGYNTKDGALQWNITLDYPVASNEIFNLAGVNDFFVYDYVAATFKCYSMKSGDLLWTSPSYADSPWATTWNVYSTETNDYDNLYLMFPDGTMTALSLETGKEIWRSKPFSSTEFTYNAVPFVSGMVMVGGNIYAYAGYSPIYELNPIPRHAMMVCVNATTGDITYTLNGGVYPYAAAGGYIIGWGRYDGKLYCIGKGQTSTSIAAPLSGITAGTALTIQGNVLDQSPAKAGIPAVADASMSEWMDYVHMQNSTLLNNPPKETGVPVKLTAVDPNGNTIDIATVTTDSAGNYGYSFVPTNPGMYTITATFEGTDSYWPSSSETKLTVTEAPAATSSAPVQTATDYTLPIVGTGIATILAVAIATVLLLRKRP
jgi:hypothetical protein